MKQRRLAALWSALLVVILVMVSCTAPVQPTGGQTTPQPTREVRRDGVDYTLIGTAHVSRASAEAVRALAETGDFDAIAVELCAARYDAMHSDRRWTDLDLYRVVRQHENARSSSITNP